LPIVDSHLLGRVIATAETQLSDPPGFFFAAMPPKRTLQKLASEKKLEAASARKTRLQLAAKMADLGEISPDRLMEAAKTAGEGSEIQPEPGPSGGCGGHAEVKAQTGAIREAATAHLISDDQESKDALGVKPSKGLTTSPKKRAGLIKRSQTETQIRIAADRGGGGRNRPPQVSW
jgi:hypothetical protein